MSRWKTYGLEPPAPDASRYERTRFIRDLLFRFTLIVFTLMLLCALAVGETWLALVVVAGTVLSLLDIGYLTFKLRRMERS